MRKLLLVGVAAALMLAAVASTASANRLATNETGITISWSRLSFSGGGSTIVCEVTLRGAFHSRTITKTLNSLIGTITAGTIGTCDGDGRATILTGTLPWHITYGGFGGRLPTITSATLNLIGASFQVSDGITCLAATTTSEPGRGIASLSGGNVTGLRADETALIDLQGGFLCELAGDSRFSGSASVTTAGGGTLTITLV